MGVSGDADHPDRREPDHEAQHRRQQGWGGRRLDEATQGEGHDDGPFQSGETPLGTGAVRASDTPLIALLRLPNDQRFRLIAMRFLLRPRASVLHSPSWVSFSPSGRHGRACPGHPDTGRLRKTHGVNAADH